MMAFVPYGFGPRGTEGKIAPKICKRERYSILGICYGFQLAASNLAYVCGLTDANSTEINPETPIQL